MVDTIKVATVNCQGLATPSKRQDVLNYYKTKGFSILCLQDTHFTSEIEALVETQWGYKCVFNSYTSNSRGVAIFFNNNFELKLHREKKDNDGNFLALDLSIDDIRVTLINVYGPNFDCPEFYEKVRECFLEFDNDYFILCGDFNVTLNQALDTHNYSHVNNPKAREKVLEIMSDLQLVDYYRVLNPDKKVFTWKRKNPLKQGRLDYILISDNFTNVVENIYIKSGYRSDHSAVVIEFKLNTFERGRGLWKFNNDLLYDTTYVDKVKQQIQFVKAQYNHSSVDSKCKLNDSAFLEILLMEIRGITISYSSFKKKERNKLECTLIEEINDIEHNCENVDQSLLEDKKQALESLRKVKLQGHFVRSRAKWVELGEKPSKYFCHLESRNFLNKTIKKVDTMRGEIIYNQSEILNSIKIFYEKLYENVDHELVETDIPNVISSPSVPCLDKDTAKRLDEYITEKEVSQVLKEMKNNKSPGSDGFTAEFFKFFWPDLKFFIISAINDIFIQKQLPISQRLGIISCLPKGDKPRQFLKNWRPITLLNVFYKLVSGCISHRIKSTLDTLIA